MTRKFARRAVAAAMLASALLTGCQAAGHARCDSPARVANGWSSYRTAGTMPSGTTRTLTDGDRWTCSNGVVTVH